MSILSSKGHPFCSVILSEPCTRLAACPMVIRKWLCCRDRETGKSRGFAFMAYEDQRSTVLAVDNLSGARVAGRTITVNHVDNYKVKRAEV